MSEHASRRWFQLSLKSLFVLTLVVAAFFAGYALALRQAEAERRRAEEEAQRVNEELRLNVEAQLLARENDAVRRSWDGAAHGRRELELARQTWLREQAMEAAAQPGLLSANPSHGTRRQ
jgi:hypothetical protein